MIALIFWLSLWVQELLFPAFCVHCKKSTVERNTWLCDDCFEQLEFLSAPVPRATESALTTLQAVVAYTEIAHSLLHELKYPGSPDVAKYCGRLLATALTLPPEITLCPVPIHTSRRRQRGFNQSEIIASEIAKYSPFPIRNLLIKIRATQQQARQSDAVSRAHNLQASIEPTLAAALAPPKTVVLVDDVVTTGATLEICAAALKKIGVETVHAVAIAHGQ